MNDFYNLPSRQICRWSDKWALQTKQAYDRHGPKVRGN